MPSKTRVPAPTTPETTPTTPVSAPVTTDLQPMGNTAAADQLTSVVPEEESALLGGPEVSLPKAGDKKDAPVDPWALSEPAKALMKQLEAAVKEKKPDSAKIKAIVDQLVGEHKVPKDVVESVAHLGDSFWKDMKNLVGGKLDVTGVKDDGSLGTRTQIDVNKQKGSFEGEKNKVDLAVVGEGGKVEWTDKKDDSKLLVEGGGKQKLAVGDTKLEGPGGNAAYSWGSEADGRETVGVTSVVKGKDVGVGTSWDSKTKNAEVERDAGWAMKDGEHTFGLGVTEKQTVGEGKDKAVVATEATSGEVVVGDDKLKIGADYSKTKDTESVKASGDYSFDGKKDEHKTEFGLSNTGTNSNGQKTSDEFKNAVTVNPDKTSISTNEKHVDGDHEIVKNKESTSDKNGVTNTTFVSEKNGDALNSVKYSEMDGKTEGHSLTVTSGKGGESVSGTITDKDTQLDGGGNTSETSGSVDYKNDNGTKDAGDDVVVKVTGSIKETVDPVNDKQSTTVAGSGDLSFKDTGLKLSVSQESGAVGGANYEVSNVNALFSRKFDLNDGSFHFSGGGNFTFSTKPGENDKFETTLTGKLIRGEGDKKNTATFSITGGQNSGADVTKTMFGDQFNPSGSLGSGAYGSGQTNPAGQYVKGSFGVDNAKSTMNGSLGYGNVDGANLLAGSFDYKSKGENPASVSLFTGLAEKDNTFATASKFTADVALDKKWSVMGGGSYQLKPTDEGYSQVYSAWAGTKYKFDKNTAVTLRGGITGTDGQFMVVPQVVLDIHKFELTTTGMFGPGQQPGVNVNLKTPVPGLSVYGGTGSTAGMSPWDGKNIADPNTNWADKNVMGAGSMKGGYIGVSWNLLSLIGQ